MSSVDIDEERVQHKKVITQKSQIMMKKMSL